MTSRSGQAKCRTENPKAISKQVNKKFRPVKQTKLSVALISDMKYSVIKASKLEITHSMMSQMKIKSPDQRHYSLWHSRLWSFKERDTKLERFLAKNQLYSNEITKF